MDATHLLTVFVFLLQNQVEVNKHSTTHGLDITAQQDALLQNQEVYLLALALGLLGIEMT